MNIADANDRQVFVCSVGVLGGWFCAHKETDEDLVLDEIIRIIREGEGGAAILEIPVDDKELVRDRLFGGFKCGVYNRRHIYYALGEYTFLHKELNEPLGAQRRADVWCELFSNNEGLYIGGGAFTSDSPKAVK